MQLPDQINTRQNVIVASLLALYVTTGSAAIGMALSALLDSLRPHWTAAILISVALGLFASSAWGIANLFRQIRDQLPGPPETTGYDPADVPPASPRPLPENERLASVARRIIEWHYLDGLEATRPECVEKGVSQTDWNLCNHIYQAIGIKSARAWQAMDYVEAITAYRMQVRIDPDLSIWCKPDPLSRTWRRV